MSKGKILLDRIPIDRESEVTLPASKSINNRVEVISALAGGSTKILNPSNARDSVLMREMIGKEEKEIDVRDAGTTFRFLTAYNAIKIDKKIITGTERMKQRPVGILVDALTELGASINYLGKPGYPPLEIRAFKYSGQHQIKIRGDVSSQYISAVMMIGPVLPEGVEIHLTGKIGSMPYIEMTLELMKDFGAGIHISDNVISIQPGGYNAPESFEIEPDWSAASYWYSFTGITGIPVTIPGLRRPSLQGDSIIAEIMETIGVQTQFTTGGIRLSPSDGASEFNYDFIHCPDLAQTVATYCAAKGITCRMTGLESLRIKETDRISALQRELSKLGVKFLESANSWIISGNIQSGDTPVLIETYEDHRMAMAFAPLSFIRSLEILDPGVVAKSYPHFWDDFNRLSKPSGS